MIRPRSSILLASLLFACGGAAGGGGGAKAPDKPAEGTESIGDLAAAKGGIASLGGAGNREDGGATGTEVAMTGPLRAEEVDKQRPVKLDGVLKEWHARSPASEVLAGKPSGVSLEVAVQYDDAKLYVGAEVADPKAVRSGNHGEADDHVRMILAFPSGRGALKAYEIGLWAGMPGESAGAVKWLSGPSKGKDVAGAKIVEADRKGGYTFEAQIPWSTFAEARSMRVGLRAAFSYHDDGGSVVATGQGAVDRPGDLPPLPTAAEQAVVDGLLKQKNLAGDPPKIDVFADVGGDERKERVSVFGKFFTICGPGYRGGHQFFWREIAGEIVALETRELTGRGKDDLVVRRRFATPSSVRETVEVWSLVGGDEPITVFAHEIGVTANDGKRRVANAVRMSPKEIEVSVEPAVGWDAATYREGSPSDYESVLLPWGTVKSRTFRYEHGKFGKASEVAQAGTPAPAAVQAANDAPAPPMPRDVPTPTVRRGTDLSKSILEAYYRDQGVPAGTKPRFDLEVNVDGDARPERVVLVGRDVVVFGPGFRGGNAYARITLSQFADDKDVTELTVRDITGDGSAEVIVRGVRRVAPPSGDRVDVDGMFIYQVTNSSIARVFSVETGRGQGAKRVQGLVQFVPAKSGRGFDIDVRPGMAKGWTEKTYPWPQDPPGGSIEPLLLPWGKVPNLRYSWNGRQFATP